RVLFVAALALAGSASLTSPLRAGEKTVRINLGTLAPRGSTYHRSLQVLAEKWKQAPAGGARLVIYPDGTQGGETDMVRLMRVRTLHAALLTAVGLAEIEPGVAGLQSLPMMFRNLDEFGYVNDQLRPAGLCAGHANRHAGPAHVGPPLGAAGRRLRHQKGGLGKNSRRGA